MLLQRSAALTTLSLILLGSSACTTPPQPDTPTASALTGTVWELQQIQKNDGTLLTANPPQNYTAEFAEDGQVFVRADCNNSIGQFTQQGDARLSVVMGSTTLAACPPGSISSDFLSALNNANNYFFQGDDLFIDLKLDSGTMQLSAAAHPPLLGTVWHLQQIQYNDGRLLVADPPENYTLELSRDGEVFARADCNRSIGQFTEQGDSRISIAMGPTTLAACPPGSISDDFLQALNNANLASFQDGQLVIDLKFDSGSLLFSATE